MKRALLCAWAMALIACTPQQDAPARQSNGLDLQFLDGAEVYQAQVVAEPDGTLLLVWVQRDGEDQLNLWVAHEDSTGAFSSPVRINREPVNRYTGDEARPDVALGPDGAIAVAWTSARDEIVVAVGREHGSVFDEPVRVSPEPDGMYRGFPAVDVGADGSVHVVWIDARFAERGAEEPADLFHARLVDGGVTERNLTADQEETICGCCRLFMTIDDAGSIDIAFRNSVDGFRDISRIAGSIAGDFAAPRQTSAPVWEIDGCPMAGPVVTHDVTVWKDGSTGVARLLASVGAANAPTALLSSTDDFDLGPAPRLVSNTEGSELVLIAARPAGLVMALRQGEWTRIAEDIPDWVTSAALRGGELILIGNPSAGIVSDVRPLESG